MDPFWVPCKKVSGHICLSLPRVELGVPKIAIFWNIIMFKNGEVDSLWGWTLPKIRITSKRASNKSCWALNSMQKSQWTHMSIYHQSEARDSKDCYRLKYYNVQKRESRFTLGLDTAENMYYIRKCFKWRKSHSRDLLMFSNVFQELSVSPSQVNSFKVTNLCKNGHPYLQNWARYTFFRFKIWQNFTSPSNFMMSQKLEPSFPNISIPHLKIQKQNLKNSWKVNEYLFKILEIYPWFLQNFPKILNWNFLGKLTKIFPKFLWNFLNNY